jgi:hypothetical protein
MANGARRPTGIFWSRRNREKCVFSGVGPGGRRPLALPGRPRATCVRAAPPPGDRRYKPTTFVHLHACVTDGVFVPAADDAERDAPQAFLPARPITPADLAALTERVRRRVIRWFCMQRLLDVDAAADMLAWENSGFSVDASVRITLIDRDVPSYFRSLEHLLRSCARPPFALERLSVIRGPDGRATRVRYVLPRHKAANWVGRGRGRTSTRPGANGVVEFSPFEFLDRLADLVPPPRKHRHRYHGVFAPNHKLRRAVTEPGAIRKILTHLGEPLEPPPVSPARGPPTDWGELVQAHDDRDVFQASPDELPVFDIHSL